MRDEILQLRQSVLTLHDRLESSHFEEPARAEAEREERAQAQRELEARDQTIFQLREQVLSMRDAIIGLETTSGDAAGERDWYYALYQGREGAAKALEEVLESRTWRATWKVMAPYRRARRMLGR